MMILFIYGASRFGDGPIRECATSNCLPHDCRSSYCSTRGYSHTADEYRAFKNWETAIFIVWPIGMAALALLRWAEKRRQWFQFANSYCCCLSYQTTPPMSLIGPWLTSALCPAQSASEGEAEARRGDAEGSTW